MKATLAGLTLAAAAFLFAAAGLYNPAAYLAVASVAALAVGVREITRKDHR